ncbi:MAG: ATP cone domain-containing protein [Patescibacteria group bacterium]
MAKINIIKSSGERVPLDTGKIIKTLEKAGADFNLAEKIAQDIYKKSWQGITTKEIYKMAMRALRGNPAIAARYSLRDAIFRLGPAGFEFEKYIMLLLRTYGYKAVLPEILKGACITHEVDILAEKDNKKMMIECKLRQGTEIFINIKDALSTWARFLDLADGAKIGTCPKVDQPWIVTNSRFSYDALNYGLCKGMVMLSWNTPKEKPLPAWIDEKKLYPITVLHSVNKFQLFAFSKAEILLLEDIVKFSPSDLAKATKLSKKQLEPILAEAREVLDFEPQINIMKHTT